MILLARLYGAQRNGSAWWAARHASYGLASLLMIGVLAAQAHAAGWETKAPMPTARTYAATGAIDGKFYVATGQLTTALEVYDPALNTWTSKAPVPTNRSQAATGTIDGKLYVVGGAINSDPRIGWTNVLEMYDPATDTWTTKMPMTTARLAMASGVIGGRLYVAGGMQSCGACIGINTLEVYDPATNTWTTKASMPTARAQMGGAVINGKLYVVGGSTGNTTPLGTLEVYDPATDTWATKAPLPTPRIALGAGEVNGILYAVSGLVANSVTTNIVEAYDPATDTWTSVDSIPTARYQSKPLGINGALYVAGSGPGGIATSSLEIFTPAAAQATSVGAWAQLSPSGAAPVVRDLHTAVYNPTSNRMIVFGGLNGPGVIGVEPLLNDVWVLANADGTGATSAWAQLGPTGIPPSARGYHTSVYDAASNRMMVFAGDPSIGYCSGALNDLWVLTNADGTGGTPNWTQLSPSGGPPPLRQDPKAVYDAATNRLMVFGGRSNACGTSSNAVWVLSNANGLGGVPVWTQLAPVGAAPTPRANHAVAYDSTSNRMVLFGGTTATGSANDVWVLEKANGLGGTPAWTQLSPTGVLPTARYFSTTVYDPGANHLVVVDGLTSSGHANDVWVLENANGLGGTPNWTKLSPTGTPPSARSSHTAVVNSSTNRMIVFAGRTCTGSCAASEYSSLNDVWVLPLGSSSNLLTSITLGQSTITIGSSTTISASPASVTLGTCSSSNSAVATVSGALVTGLAAGTATISCGSVSAGLTVTSRTLSGISLSLASISVGATATILPNPADAALGSCSSTNSAVANVNGTVVSAVAIGVATIQCGSFTTALAVVAPTLTGIVVGSSSLVVGATTTITPLPSQAALGVCASSDTTVATVSGSLVQAVGPGNVFISCGNASAALTVAASSSTLTELTVNCPITIASGQTDACSARAVYSNDTTRIVQARWISDSAALTVDVGGNLQASNVSANVLVNLTATYTEGKVTLTKKSSVQVLASPLGACNGTKPYTMLLTINGQLALTPIALKANEAVDIALCLANFDGRTLLDVYVAVAIAGQNGASPSWFIAYQSGPFAAVQWSPWDLVSEPGKFMAKQAIKNQDTQQIVKFNLPVTWPQGLTTVYVQAVIAGHRLLDVGSWSTAWSPGAAAFDYQP